jgi:hypothetical protein
VKTFLSASRRSLCRGWKPSCISGVMTLMNTSQTLLLTAALLAAGTMAPAYANESPRRAVITGGGGPGRCTIELNVDGSAEVEVRGEMGVLRTISGQPSTWLRFHCNTSLPRNPGDFRVTRIDGRGSVRILREPSRNGGTAVIRVDDPKGGRARYAFDLHWRDWRGGTAPSYPAPPSYPGHGPGNFPSAGAVQACQDSVISRLHRDGYRYVTFGRVVPTEYSGRHDWVTGTATGKRGFETAWFSFSCTVDSRWGTVRSVEVRRR